MLSGTCIELLELFLSSMLLVCGAAYSRNWYCLGYLTVD